MSEKSSNWGGKREGAGRRPTAPDGTARKMRSLRASDGEWETLKEFAKILKDDPARAERIMKTE